MLSICPTSTGSFLCIPAIRNTDNGEVTVPKIDGYDIREKREHGEALICIVISQSEVTQVTYVHISLTKENLGQLQIQMNEAVQFYLQTILNHSRQAICFLNTKLKIFYSFQFFKSIVRFNLYTNKIHWF